MKYPRLLEKINSFLVNSLNNYANYRWFHSPLAKKPIGTKEQYLEIAEKTRQLKYLVIDEFEQKYGYFIEQRWMHQLALHTQVVIKKSKINYQHGRLLYSALRYYINKNRPGHLNIIETGTARGFSSTCMAKALSDSGTFGKIITFDVLPHHHKMYWNCIDDIERKKTRSELLKDYHDLTDKYVVFHQGNTLTELPKVQMERIHFAFLDGSHDYYYLMSEFMNICDKQQKGDITFFDDYTPKLFPGVVKAVDEICEKYQYSKEIVIISDMRAYVIAEKQ